MKRNSNEWDWRYWRTAWVKASKIEKKNTESKRNCERYTVKKRAVNEKRKRVFFFIAQVVSISVIVKLFENLSHDFFLQKESFLCKFLCFYVIVLSLCLLKFINSSIEFFPTGSSYLTNYLRAIALINNHDHYWRFLFSR